MEPISLAIMAAAAGKAVDSLLGDQANRLVASIVGGVIGNRADRLVCGATRASWDFFRNLRSEDPALNHDLERGTREAYLLATLELLRQAEHRVEVGGARLLGAGDAEAVAALRRGAEADLRDVGNTLPEPLPDAHLFLIDPALAPAERLDRMRAVLRTNLARDVARWCPGRDVPPIVETLLESGWTIDTKYRQNVHRDWYSLIALAFAEKLKTAPRLAAIFESKMLAHIAAREPAAAAVGTVSGLSLQLDTLLVPLQRIEDRLGILSSDVSEIRHDVKEIKRSLDLVAKVPRAAWAAAVVLLIAGTLGLATDGLPRLACRVPGVRSACAQVGLGGVPSPAETALWSAREPGNCATLRAYLQRFPAGAYADEAARQLAARRTEERQSWHPEEKEHVFVVRTSATAMTSEEAARADAQNRARVDAELVCGPYRAGDYRLISTRVEAREWRCSRRADGVRCGFDGVVSCRVDARRVDLADVCN